MTPEEVLRDYVGAFVSELARTGVTSAVVCPGSRSTPLAMLLEEHPAIKVWMHYDERSAAYFALGIAKTSQKPVALLCTSGTAAANFLPAVVEAFYSRAPLLVLTADRPPELQQVGAAQTIDQRGLYGRQVKWFAEAMLPEATPEALRYVRSLADRAVATAQEMPAGPVHLNFPFREPLVPARPGWPSDDGDHAPLVSVHGGRIMGGTTPLRQNDLFNKRRGIIVCGPHDGWELRLTMHRLSGSIGYPVLAEPLSQMRSSASPPPHAVSRYDAFLRDPAIVAALEPEVVIRLGGLPTSKPLQQYLQRYRGCRHILVDISGWNDPLGVATDIVHADPTQYGNWLADLAYTPDEQWIDTWKRIDSQADAAIGEYLPEIDELFEGKVFAELANLLPDGTFTQGTAILWTGSSMPVRDLDTFFPAVRKDIQFMANRGANGIDGVVSSAMGTAASLPATSVAKVVLVVGDLSFYHDLNGLLAARLHQPNITIIVLNNDGGGIFSFLPQHEKPHFEKLFGTPHGLDFRPAVEMYGGHFQRVLDWPSFRQAVTAGLQGRGLHVIEVPTDRERNVVLHREVWKRVREAVASGVTVAR